MLDVIQEHCALHLHLFTVNLLAELTSRAACLIDPSLSLFMLYIILGSHDIHGNDVFPAYPSSCFMAAIFSWIVLFALPTAPWDFKKGVKRCEILLKIVKNILIK